VNPEDQTERKECNDSQQPTHEMNHQKEDDGKEDQLSHLKPLFGLGEHYLYI